MLQINTSGEEAKGGFQTDEEVIQAVAHLRDNCKHLKFGGLMTIGSAENSKMSAEQNLPNPDFEKEGEKNLKAGAGLETRICRNSDLFCSELRNSAAVSNFVPNFLRMF